MNTAQYTAGFAEHLELKVSAGSELEAYECKPLNL